MNKIIAVIPARAGSKGIPNKNIRMLGGNPLISYSIDAAHKTRLIDEVFVSTDSEEIAEIAQDYGATIPFIRPSDLATDEATDLMWMTHFVAWLKANNELPELIVHLSPPTPLRDPLILEQAISYMLTANGRVTSLRSVEKTESCPYKDFRIENGYLKGLFDELRGEYYNLPRQKYPLIYKTNGYIDIVKPEVILDQHYEGAQLHGDKILAFETAKTIELDTMSDWEQAELYFTNHHIYISKK